MKKYFFLFLSLGFLFLSCSDDLLKADKETIKAYLSKNNINAEEQSSGIFFASTTEGTGEHPSISSTVKVKYKGYYLDGTVFDQTTGNNTATFSLQNVIKGFREGILLMKKGGKATIFIPSELGYGSNPPQGIRKNEILVFDVELLDF